MHIVTLHLLEYTPTTTSICLVIDRYCFLGILRRLKTNTYPHSRFATRHVKLAPNQLRPWVSSPSVPRVGMLLASRLGQ